MKKYKLNKWVLLINISVMLNANAVFGFGVLPPGPVSPTIDPLTNVAESLEGASAQLLTAQDELQQLQGEVLSEIKSFTDNIGLNLGNTLFNKEKDKANLSSARTIEECQIADITNEASIVEAFHTLFLTYPADILEKYPENQRAVKLAYKNKAIEFGNDAMIEMYITVRDLEEKMEALKEEYDELSTCYVQGGSSNSSSCSSASSTEEELGVWSNYYKLNVIYDSMLSITEELIALKAQYEVAQAVLAGIEPVEETSEEDQVSYNDVFRYVRTDKNAFAQMFATMPTATSETTAETTQTTVSTVTTQTASSDESTTQTGILGSFVLTNNNAVAEQPNPNLDIVQATAYDISSPFAGTADQFQALIIANNAYQTVQKALKAHNLKQQMPEYRKVFVEYNKMKTLHEKAIEQLVKSENCAVNYIGKYYEDPIEMWYGEGCKLSGQNIFCDSNRSLTTEALKNLLPGDSLCENDKSKICSSYSINSYSSRAGFSGWLISAYKTAKAEKALNLDENDFATGLTEEDMETDVSNLASLSDQYSTEAQAGTSDISFLRPSDEPKTEAAIRESNLVAWQLGAEAAKAIGNDMASGSSEWGKLESKYPLWDDDKLVYKQYLTEKYKNMRIYIQTMNLQPFIAKFALAINDLLPSTGTVDEVVDWADVKSYNNSFLNKVLDLVSADKKNTKSFEEVENVQQQIDNAMNSLRTSFNAQMVSLNNQKDSIYVELDDENLALNDYKTEYNSAMQDKAAAEGDIEGQKVVIQISQERKAKSSDVMSNFESTAESTIVESNKTIATATQKAESVLPEIEIKRKSIDTLKVSLENKENEISHAKSSFAAEASSLEAQGISKLKAEITTMENAKASLLGNSSYLNDVANTTTYSNAIMLNILKSIITIADNGASNIREKIISKIDETAELIENMEDRRFDEAYYADITNLHKQMLDYIQHPDISISISDGILGSLLSVSTVNKLAEEIVVEEIFKEICAGNTCYESDSEYFVGLPPKPQDFMAPKKIAATPTAPLREVVHFDNTDFNEIVKSDTWMTTRYDFLNQGQEMPEIWRRILGGKGFVERDIDIEDILSYDTAVLDNLRMGLYPCTTGKYDIELRNGNYYITSASGESKGFCSEIQSVKIEVGTVGPSATIYFTNGGVVSGNVSQAPDKEKTSELATILTYKNGITFNDYVKQIMEFYENLENSDDIDEDDEEQEKLFRKTLLIRNQFGNFLDFVEQEMLYQDNLDQLDVKVDSNRTKIMEQLETVGTDYTLEADFDLSDTETYDELVEMLDSTKNKYVQEVINLLQSIQPLNDVIEEKITKINNIAGALQMDSDELIQLNDNMSGDSELSEKIKSKQTDNAVRDEYDKEAQSAYEDNLNNFEEPYCANYD